MTHQVVIFPRGQLDPKDRERLMKAGIVSIEADDPTKVVCVLPMASIIGGDDIFRAAVEAIKTCDYNDARLKFGAALCRAIKPPEPK